MLSFPVVVIPPRVETWRVDGGRRNYLVLGCGNLPVCQTTPVVLGFQGSGVLNNTYIRNIDDARQVIAECATAESVRQLMFDAKGSISLQIFSPVEQAVYFFNDPLGGAPIYRYRNGSCEAYSSDLGSLVAAIRLRNEKLQGEVKYFAAGYLTGTQSYGASTPYKEIDLIRRGFGIKIDEEGNVSQVVICSAETLYTPNETYEQGLSSIREEVRSNVQIAADGNFASRYAHLTAGFDSRLVLAAIRNLGLQDRFVFSCIEKSADWDIATSLAAELDLTFSGFEGNTRATGYALNYYESLTRRARRSFGAIVSGIEPSFIPANNLIFQGGYGEVGRTFNSFQWDGGLGAANDLAYRMWQYASFPQENSRNESVWSGIFLEEVISGLESYALEAANLGIQTDFLTNYIYVEGRNRGWIGLQSYYASGIRSQFDPLYSKLLVSTPRLLDFNSRKSNFLGFDLMKSLDSDLLEYPFDRPRVGWLYEKSRGKVPRRTFSGKTPRFVAASLTSPKKPWPGKIEHIEAFDAETASALGLSSLIVHGVRKYANESIQMIVDTKELRDIYRPEFLLAKWNHGTPLAKDDYLALNNVIATLFLSGRLKER